MSPHAAIDVASNTVHLLVGEVEDGAVLSVTGEKVSARLGAGVDKAGRIEAARIPVAAEAIRLFAHLAALNGTYDRVRPQEGEEPFDSQRLLLEELF